MSTLCRDRNLVGERLPAFGRKRDFRGGNDSPSKALPGLEKDQNRCARLAMRGGLLTAYNKRYN